MFRGAVVLGMVLAFAGLGGGPACAAGLTTTRSTQPATASVDPTTPRGALKALAQALDRGDREAVLRLLWADGQQQHEVALATANLAQATAALRSAGIRKFGADAARPLGVEPGATLDAMARIDAAQVDVQDDHATIRTKDQEGPPLTLIRRDGTWRIPVSELSKDVEPADIDRNLKDVATQTQLMQALTAEVLAGKFKSALDARQALDERILHSTMPELEPSTKPTAAAPPAQP